MEVCQHPKAPKKNKTLSDEKVTRLPNCPEVILGLEANTKRPNVKLSEAMMTGKIASLDSFPKVPHRKRSVRRIKPKILTSPNTHQQKGSEILKPQCGRKRKCKQKADETIELEVVRPSSGRERLRRRMSSGNEITNPQGKLDTCTFQCYFENLWKSFPDEKRNSFAYLDCLWFNLYLKPNLQANVLKWIKKKQIFSKKYVIVPIVLWDHWSLLIFCHMGESLQSETSTPCMLLLDSLGKANPKRLEPEIRKFVLDLYKTEERPENRKQIYRIPLKIPKVPQQMNGEDCGNFVLYYINLFIENAPESFSISEGYPYFMKNDWFTQDSLANFRERLREGDTAVHVDDHQPSSEISTENLERQGRKRNQVHVDDHQPASEISTENLERQERKRNQVHVVDHHPSSEISTKNLERQGRRRNQVHVADHHPSSKISTEHLATQGRKGNQVHVAAHCPSSEISSENLERRGIKGNQVHVADNYSSESSSAKHQEKQVKENKSGSSKKKEKKSNEDLNLQISTPDDVSQDIDSINEITFEEGDVPPPVCSCTGFPRQCYKSGNGGWQSSCCTTTLSVYPLPHLQNKRHSRIVGRKMSGNVFGRLLTRLAEEGHDLSVPLDLKNYWAKHGTNGYLTVK